MSFPGKTPEVAVLAPLLMELAAFRRALTDPRKVLRGGRKWLVGNLGEIPVLTAVLGDGRRRSTATLKTLFRAFPMQRVLLIGVAGGLDPALEVGRVVVAHRIFREERPAPPPDAAWLGTSLAAGLTAADVVSVERIVATPDEKAQLWQRLGKERPAVVDLESAALAQAATEAGVPYLVLRAVSDGAEETLPGVIPRSQRADGSVNPLGVAARALFSPAAIPRLMRLQRRMNRCAEALAAAASQLCRKGLVDRQPPGTPEPRQHPEGTRS